LPGAEAAEFVAERCPLMALGDEGQISFGLALAAGVLSYRLHATPAVDVRTLLGHAEIVHATRAVRQALKISNQELDAMQGAMDAGRALDTASTKSYDAILLDVMLPGGTGFDVCRTLRQRGVQTPILMLTARGQVIDRVVGLKLGADDYLVKPFEMAELLARIEALLRRSSTSGSSDVTAESYRFGDIAVDFRRAEVTKSGKVLELSAREFKLLRYFIEHRGAALTRDELLNEVWGYNAMPSTRTVDVHVAWLRQKLEDNPRHPEYIHTVHGLGYKFVG
jgi:two-component system alkaline phosphatase synthesis response regulator PhoP